MNVQVNNRLLKSRNPKEHGFKLENQMGYIVHTLGDGYNLIRFNHLKIKELKRIDGVKKITFDPLEWYIHESDLKIL